ncbi:tRNA lysidine(34) synthetase TilS [Sporosarcina jiandibaonis]|uniref:tRNA lysidine(34) synthetase TilS n=1 Tax=Sporosarcina jiandibaonis TaxID=2715535 RepID=UPI0015516E29|nr:tRNA lysidine(34) synthetase TilS [Sporosarcina jiandibaonis]
MESFSDTILQFINENRLLKAQDRVLVACSGGVDSIALLHFLAVHREKLAIEVAAVHVDHMLRGKESALEGDLVSDLCRRLKVPFYGGQVPVPKILENEGGNVQAVCRAGRYDFFEETLRLKEYNVLATAHHAEDQLETVLMQLTKGSVPSGIPIKREIGEGMLIRPFLPAIKETLYAYVKENDVQFSEDPSNKSDAYMRNRFRRDVIPHIIQENPKAPERVAAMVGNLQEDEAFLWASAEEQLGKIIGFTEEGLPTISKQSFGSMPTALQRRMIKLLLDYLYDNNKVLVRYKYTLIEQLLHHLNSEDGNVSIHLPLGYRFVREYDKLTFVKEDSLSNPSAMIKIMPQGEKTDWLNNGWIYWAEIDEARPDILEQAKEIRYFNVLDDSLPLSVRQRKEGDRMLLAGMANPKRLSRLFIDEKVKLSLRDELPVIVTNNDEVCAVPGLRYGASFSKNRLTTSRYIFILGNYNSITEEEFRCSPKTLKKY